MKKLLLLCFILIIPFFIFASPQKYYPVSSYEWQLVDAVCRINGVPGPSSSGPVTASQLSIALDRAEQEGGESSIIDKARELVGSVNSFYSDDFGSIAMSLEGSLEGYIQTSGKKLEEHPFDKDGDWFIRSHKERPSLIELNLENIIGDVLYSRFVLPIRERGQRPLADDIGFYWNENFHTGLSCFVIQQNFPFDAGISIGGKGVSLITGRGSVSQGEGFTGNTTIGDNYDYQEFFKFGFNTRNTGVYLNLTSFDSSRRTEKDSGITVDCPYRTQNTKFSGYRELRHAMTYEATLFDKVKISLSMITLFDTNNGFDFRFLNPFMVMHNIFDYHNDTILEANNMMSVDFSWAITKGLRLYFQLTMDQIQITGESDGYVSAYGYTDPNAFAGLLNLSYSFEKGEGIGTIFAEGVYTMPGMYLNQKYYNALNGNVTQMKTTEEKKEDGTIIVHINEPCWSQDYLLGYNRTETSGYVADMAFSGYKYGPDAVVFALGGNYSVPTKYKVSGEAFYMAHGEKGTGYASDEDYGNYNFSGIDTIDAVNAFRLTGVIEHTLVLKAEGDWYVNKYLSLYGGMAYSYRWNYRNKENKNVGNLQMALGVTLKYAL